MPAPVPCVLYVGTVGQSIWRSTDGGESFARASNGVHSECDVRALLTDPADPRHLLLGTETGLFRTWDGADSWSRIGGLLDGRQVWCLARDPRTPQTLYAGTCPAAIFRSTDGGETWQECAAGMPAECVGGAPLVPRVTCILVDAVDGALFAGVEIAGVRRSLDGGTTWQVLGTGLSSLDIHGLAATWNGRRTLLATTNNDVNRSVDDGASWSPLRVDAVWPWRYSRACAVPPGDPSCVWVGAGNGPPGDQGGLYRTRDLGESWERLPLPGVINSTIWCFAFHPHNPRLAFAASVSGQLFRTSDGGASWSRLAREFGEVRALAWTPVP